MFTVPGRSNGETAAFHLPYVGVGGGVGSGVKIGLLKEFGSVQWILISLLLCRGNFRWLSRDIALVNNSSDTVTITELFLGKNPKVPA